MSNSFLLFLFFGLVTLSHGVFLILAKNSSSSDRKALWKIHNWVNRTLWWILFLWIAVFQFVARQYIIDFITTPLGIVIGCLGFVLIGKSYMKLGFDRAMGSRFFFHSIERIQKGPYKILRNPMYDGFMLVFLGLGITFGIVEDFYLALLSFLLLNVFLASVENFSFPQSIFDFF
jgi:protein-S-isoprenylcysteine O-methyltransferase Ste14